MNIQIKHFLWIKVISLIKDILKRNSHTLWFKNNHEYYIYIIDYLTLKWWIFIFIIIHVTYYLRMNRKKLKMSIEIYLHPNSSKKRDWPLETSLFEWSSWLLVSKIIIYHLFFEHTKPKVNVIFLQFQLNSDKPKNYYKLSTSFSLNSEMVRNIKNPEQNETLLVRKFVIVQNCLSGFLRTWLKTLINSN